MIMPSDTVSATLFPRTSWIRTFIWHGLRINSCIAAYEAVVSQSTPDRHAAFHISSTLKHYAEGVISAASASSFTCGEHIHPLSLQVAYTFGPSASPAAPYSDKCNLFREVSYIGLALKSFSLADFF
jgi:hypothetical protein